MKDTEPQLSRLIEHIGHDVRTIASDELELGRSALAARLEALVAKAGVVLLGATVALIGLAMLCLTAVVALHGLIPPLWLRMLIMSVVYMAIGLAVAAAAARRIGALDAGDLERPIAEVGDTLEAIEKGLTH